MSGRSDRIGDVITERYELVDIIGRGGQGIVYRGRDRWMDRDVAVKVFSSRAAREPQTVQRLAREQQAMSALKGTAAVELLDVCRGNDGELCLVMELLSGVTLEDHLCEIEDKGERLELLRVAEIFDPIVATLEVAHEAGILHRDLKPANVFLLDYGAVRLLDFGLARLRSSAPMTAAGIVMGSPSYIAPEVWKGQPDLIDHRVDVYSLGVVLFRVLAGQLPFAGESLHEKFFSSTKSPRPSLLAIRPDLPRDADQWVEMALAIKREERFNNVRALWNAFLATFDVEVPGHEKNEPRYGRRLGAPCAILRHSEEKSKPAPAARSSELSFVSQALLSSMPVATNEPSADIVLGPPSTEHHEAPPPPRPMGRPTPPPPRPPRPDPPASRKKPPPPPRMRPPVTNEKTIEITDLDFSESTPVELTPAREEPTREEPTREQPTRETTLEISNSELVTSETTRSMETADSFESSPSMSAKTKLSRKQERARKRKQRRKQRRKKR